MDFTLHNLPAHVLDDLKRAARLNGRSVNDEAIARLERGITPGAAHPQTVMGEIRALRKQYPLPARTPEELERAIEYGRASVEELLEEIEEMQARYALPELTPEFLEQAKNEGRA